MSIIMVLGVFNVAVMVSMYGRIGRIILKSVAAEKLRMRDQMPSTSNVEAEMNTAVTSADSSNAIELTTPHMLNMTAKTHRQR